MKASHTNIHSKSIDFVNTAWEVHTRLGKEHRILAPQATNVCPYFGPLERPLDGHKS